MLEYTACSIKGIGRRTNEDRVLLDNRILSNGNAGGSSDYSMICVVSDGVGGEEGGAAAAELVVNEFQEMDLTEISPLLLFKHIRRINRGILQSGRSSVNGRYMAATAAGMMFWGNRYLAFHLGDTRIYERNGESVYLRSKDHYDDALHGITCYFGGQKDACYPSVRWGTMEQDHCQFFICTDGVYKGLSRQQIDNILVSEKSLAEKKRAILEQSYKNGSDDDMSMVLVSYSADSSVSVDCSSKEYAMT